MVCNSGFAGKRDGRRMETFTDNTKGIKVASDNSLLMTPIEELKKLRTKVLEKTVPGASWNCNIENQPLELLLTGRYEELCFEIADKNEPLLEFTLKKDNIVLKQKREDGWQIRTCSYYDDIMRKCRFIWITVQLKCLSTTADMYSQAEYIRSDHWILG